MANLIAPAGSPFWLSDVVLQINRLFVPTVPKAPQRLPFYDKTDLPKASAFPDAIIVVKDAGTFINIGVSNGTVWINPQTGSPF